jgi:electron transfer flavoprotein alpha subunit
VQPGRADVPGCGGRTLASVAVDGPFVATLQPGVRGIVRQEVKPRVVTIRLPGMVTGRSSPPVPESGADAAPGGGAGLDRPVDPDVLELIPADPATLDLADATRVVGAGAGLGSAAACERLRRVGLAIGAATGGTRVVTDWGWLPVDRQIGTTGVAVHPELYLAFGVSGAVQHVSGLGRPAHVVSVNVDAACPMSAMADLAVVADAPATLVALARLLEVEP